MWGYKTLCIKYKLFYIRDNAFYIKILIGASSGASLKLPRDYRINLCFIWIKLCLCTYALTSVCCYIHKPNLP